MISFHSGIIKGKITYGTLKILDEKLYEDREEFIVSPESIREFLKEHDYRFTFNKKTGTLAFSKNFMGNNLEEILDIAGVSKAELARRINTHRTYVNDLCKSKNIEVETAYKILAALSLEAADIEQIFPLKNKHLIGF